jgi:hypothetical protein
MLPLCYPIPGPRAPSPCLLFPGSLSPRVSVLCPQAPRKPYPRFPDSSGSCSLSPGSPGSYSDTRAHRAPVPGLRAPRNCISGSRALRVLIPGPRSSGQTCLFSRVLPCPLALAHCSWSLVSGPRHLAPDPSFSSFKQART